MDWLAENWFWVLVGIAFIGMHMFGHGGHGGHGTHGDHGKHDDDEDEDKQRKNQTHDSGHKHH